MLLIGISSQKVLRLSIFHRNFTVSHLFNGVPFWKELSLYLADSPDDWRVVRCVHCIDLLLRQDSHEVCG